MTTSRLPRLIAAVALSLAAGPLLGAAPAHAASGLSVTDPGSDVDIAAQSPKKFTKIAQSLEILKASASGGGKVRFTLVTKKPLAAADPGKKNPVGATFLLCEGVPDGGCTGTVITYTDTGDPTVEVNWQDQGDREIPDGCGGTAKVGRSIVVTVPRECLATTSGVTLTANIIMRHGKPGPRAALISDDTDASDVGDL